jgi:hypothetical protein
MTFLRNDQKILNNVEFIKRDRLLATHAVTNCRKRVSEKIFPNVMQNFNDSACAREHLLYRLTAARKVGLMS